MLNIVSTELDVTGNLCEILDMYFGYENKHGKIIQNEYRSHFEDWRNINQDGKPKYVNNKLSELPIHEYLQKLNINDVMMDFDATSLNRSSKWDEKTVYSKMNIGFAFKP